MNCSNMQCFIFASFYIGFIIFWKFQLELIRNSFSHVALTVDCIN